MLKNEKFIEFLHPTKNKRRKLRDTKVLASLEWVFRDECEEEFEFDFINECFSNILKKYYGLIGSAGYRINIKSIYQSEKICEIILNYNDVEGFWSAMSQASNRLGVDGLIEFKIRIIDISFIKENENAESFE